jgi:arylsulfatase A-like enzyme
MRGILRGLCAATVIYAAQSHADNAGQGLSPAPSPEHSPSSIGSDRPNFVFIIVDDMERTMLNALPEGKGRNLTPNLDRLVNEGVLMTGQHVASAVCTPSRYNVLTGQYASRAMPVGPHEQAVVGFETHIKPTDATLPKLLRDAGYRTGMVGKNHVIKAPGIPEIPLEADPRDPEVVKALQSFRAPYDAALQAAGFDEAGGIFPGNPDELRPRSLRIHNMDYIAEAAVGFLNKPSSKKPFFLYMATSLPHGPVEESRSWNSDPTLGPYGPRDTQSAVLPPRHTIRERLEKAGLPKESLNDPEQGASMMLALDDAIGAVMDRLKANGQLDNTIVFFFNDHGTDAKGTLYQGGLQYPSVVWRKGGFPCGSTSSALVSNVDFAPTILEFAGIPFAKEAFDGQSFREILLGASPPEDRVLYSEMGFTRAIRVGDWKYLAIRYPKEVQNMTVEERRRRLEEWNAGLIERGITPVNTDPAAPFSHLSTIPGGAHAEHSTTGKKPHYYDSDQLFHLADDPSEERNLADDPAHAARLAGMKETLKSVLRKLPGSFGEFTRNDPKKESQNALIQ